MGSWLAALLALLPLNAELDPFERLHSRVCLVVGLRRFAVDARAFGESLHALAALRAVAAQAVQLASPVFRLAKPAVTEVALVVVGRFAVAGFIVADVAEHVIVGRLANRHADRYRVSFEVFDNRRAARDVIKQEGHAIGYLSCKPGPHLSDVKCRRRRWHRPKKPLVHQIRYLYVIAVDALPDLEEAEGPNLELLDGAIIGKLDLFEVCA